MADNELVQEVSAALIRHDVKVGLYNKILRVLERGLAGCDGCIYRGTRHQKCSCCVRNHYMKDCYVTENGRNEYDAL